MNKIQINDIIKAEHINAGIEAYNRSRDSDNRIARKSFFSNLKNAFAAKISSYSETYRLYSFQEVFWDDSSEDWGTKTNGRGSTDIYNAVELNENENVDANTIVVMIRVNNDGDGEPLYAFLSSKSLPDGSSDGDIAYWDSTDEEWKILSRSSDAYMVLQVNSDGDGITWDYVRSHS